MPYINLQVTKGITREQKRQIVAAFTQTLVDVLGKKPEHTHIVIDEIETDNWGFAGELTTVLRKNQARLGAKKTAAKADDAEVSQPRRKVRTQEQMPGASRRASKATGQQQAR